MPHMPHLDAFQADWQSICCCRISQAAISKLASRYTGLQRLELYWNVNVRDEALFAVAACTQLSHLNFSGCFGITDEGMKIVASCCTQLLTLDLTRWMQI